MGANDKVAATFRGGECTPDADGLRDLWVDSKLDHLPRAAGIPLVPTVQAEFDRWLETVRAEAKAEPLREAASDVFDTEMPAHTARWLEDRANQYKGTTDA
ncbi:hypothetical protein FQA45_00230 [Glutamicibacter halophytocola]|uniref:Uncharacterized protein n=1 Tax=Glutamicibacter halophytocola TaxID=1933880 RepID=A0ABX5Y676_9MICC|nr:hypothetical protein [Glutamicibacter halophytocola]QDY64861.1 hypothetical protein FQA45_00230 [Glutamicibacter halophytocola]